MGCAQSRAAKTYSEDQVQITRPAEELSRQGSGKFLGWMRQGSQKIELPSSQRNRRMSLTGLRVVEALAAKQKSLSDQDKQLTFSKVVLSFEKLRGVMTHVRQVFNSASHGKVYLELEDFVKVMDILHGNVTRPQVVELFDLGDMQSNRQLTFKQFLVCLAIGYTLDMIPALSDNPPPTSPKRPKGVRELDRRLRRSQSDLRKSASQFFGHSDAVKEMMHLVVSAYLLFDKTGKGFIYYAEVQQVLAEVGNNSVRPTSETGGIGASAMLSNDRWKELDWDQNGSIDFEEFVATFCAWVQLQDVDDDGDLDEDELKEEEDDDDGDDDEEEEGDDDDDDEKEEEEEEPQIVSRTDSSQGNEQADNEQKAAGEAEL